MFQKKKRQSKTKKTNWILFRKLQLHNRIKIHDGDSRDLNQQHNKNIQTNYTQLKMSAWEMREELARPHIIQKCS